MSTESNGLTPDIWETIDKAPRGKTIIMFAVTETEDGEVTNWRMDSGFIRYGDDDPFQADREGLTGVYWRGRWLKAYELMPTHWHPMPKVMEEFKIARS